MENQNNPLETPTNNSPFLQKKDFWLYNPKVLFDKYLHFVPQKNQTYIERLNSIARFCIYSIIVLRFFNRTGIVYYGIIMTLLSTILMYENSSQKDKEKFSDIDDKFNEICTRPTEENPFMNMLLPEYLEHPDRPPACKMDYKDKQGNEPVRDAVYSHYYDKIFRNVDDIFNNQTFFRHYTMPVTENPNDREKFTRYLFNDVIEGTCKDRLNPDRCVLYEDLRVKRDR